MFIERYTEKGSKKNLKKFCRKEIKGCIFAAA